MSAMLEVKGIDKGSQPPLLFVHGAWHGAWCWEPLMKHLAEKGFTSYAFDLPGHGARKTEGVSGLGIMDYVTALEAAFAELEPTQPILIGHSMGELIVQKYLEKWAAPAAVLIAPCPAMGGSLNLLLKYAWHQPIAGLEATCGQKTAIRGRKMCHRLFFNFTPFEEFEAHFERLCLESSRAIRQMVLPFFKLNATKITSTPVAVAAAGKDYFFGYKGLRNWAEEYGYDFLPFPEAAHNLLCKPEEFDFGKMIYKWLDQKIGKS